MLQSTFNRRTLEYRGKSSICKIVSQTQHDRINNLPDKSSTLQNCTESNDQNKKKSKLDTRQNVSIIGDSINNYQDERLHTNKKRIVKARSHTGVTSETTVNQ